MKHIITGLLITFLSTFSTVVYSQHRHGHHPHFHHHHRAPVVVYRNHWVAPAVVGGLIVGAAIAHASQTNVVYVEQTPVQKVTECTEWREVLTVDGNIVKERTCYQR
jgi:hypothetical protein